MADLPNAPPRKRRIREWVEKVGSKAGRFLSNFTYVLTTLLLYLLFSLVTYVWLAIQLGSFRGKASFIAYDVATGGAALPYYNDLKPFPVLWAWILIFHVLSWLVVPVLAATAVDAAYRIVEERRNRAERKLRRRIRRIGRERLQLSGHQLDEFEDEEFEKMRP